MIAYRLVPLV
jgi:hypothetical protein